MAKKSVGAKISPVTEERLEEYAEEVGISKSEAVDRLLKKALDLEDMDTNLLSIQSDGGTPFDDELSEVNRNLETVNQSIQQRAKYEQYQYALLLIGILWIGIQLSVGLGTIATVATGIPIMAGLAWVHLKTRGG